MEKDVITGEVFGQQKCQHPSNQVAKDINMEEDVITGEVFGLQKCQHPLGYSVGRLRLMWAPLPNVGAFTEYGCPRRMWAPSPNIDARRMWTPSLNMDAPDEYGSPHRMCVPTSTDITSPPITCGFSED